MKQITLLALGFLISISSASAQTVRCHITAKTTSECAGFAGKKATFQIYDGLYKNGTSAQCAISAEKTSGIPEHCAQVRVQRARGQQSPEERYGSPVQTVPVTTMPIEVVDTPKPIAQASVGGNSVQGVITKLEDINTDDGVSESEIQYAIGLIMSFIQGMFASQIQSQVGSITDTVSGITGTVADTVGSIKDSVVSSIPFTGDDNEGIEQETEEDEFYTTDEDFETDPYGADPKSNTFNTRDWDGTEIARMVDPYGKEQFTSDGKHFYDNEYDAAHSQEGLSNITNIVGDTTSNVFDFLFVGSNKDADIQLQNEIAGEVLKDSQSQSEKDVEKAYEKISGKIKTPKFGDVPAQVIVMVAEESKKADFAQGVRRYISDRKKGSEISYIRENFPEELVGGYGTMGKGVSQSTVAKQAEGVLFARYEESYQRYLLAKQLGRK